MTTLLHELRRLRKAAGPVYFARDWSLYDEANRVEVHLHRPWSSDDSDGDTRFLGGGENHADAIRDAFETLKVRRRIARREGLGDYLRDQRKDDSP